MQHLGVLFKLILLTDLNGESFLGEGSFEGVALRMGLGKLLEKDDWPLDSFTARCGEDD
jgi:hypothetical protein